MFQWDAVDTSPDLAGQNVPKTVEMAIRRDRRERESFLSLNLFPLTFKNIFSDPLTGAAIAPSPPPMDRPLMVCVVHELKS